MSNKQESQCYFMQLQIDSYLDGELSTAQRDVFIGHVHACQACASELRYAQRIHDTVLDLPAQDCPAGVLAPLRKLGEPPRRESFWAQCREWFTDLGPGWRVALPTGLAALLIAALLPLFIESKGGPVPATTLTATAPEPYSTEEVVAALRELNVAIDYLNEVSTRTEAMIGNRFVLAPLRESLNASFQRIQSEQTTSNGPI